MFHPSSKGLLQFLFRRELEYKTQDHDMSPQTWGDGMLILIDNSVCTVNTEPKEILNLETSDNTVFNVI